MIERTTYMALPEILWSLQTSFSHILVYSFVPYLRLQVNWMPPQFLLLFLPLPKYQTYANFNFLLPFYKDIFLIKCYGFPFEVEWFWRFFRFICIFLSAMPFEWVVFGASKTTIKNFNINLSFCWTFVMKIRSWTNRHRDRQTDRQTDRLWQIISLTKSGSFPGVEANFH